MQSHPSSESTNASGENSSRSLICSPTPAKSTGRFSSCAMATAMPPLAVPSSLVSTMPVTPAACVNCRAWLQSVLAGGRVHHQQHLMGRAGNQFGRRAAHLVQFVHQAGFGVQAAGGIHNQLVDLACLGGGGRVVEHRRRIAAVAGLDHLHAGARRPRSQAARWPQRERCRPRIRERSAPAARYHAASLPLVVVLPVPLTPTKKVTLGPSSGDKTLALLTMGASRMARNCALSRSRNSSPPSIAWRRARSRRDSRIDGSRLHPQIAGQQR